jgi:CRP-like cAMP-binding protein
MPQDPSASFDAQAFLDAVGLRGTKVEYAQDAAIYRQADRCDGVFYILSGQVRLTVPPVTSSIATLGPSEFFGEGCLTGQPRRLTAAHASTPTTLRIIPTDEMSRLLKEQPLLSDHFLTYLLRRSVHVERAIVRHAFSTTERKFARALIRLALDAITEEQELLPATSETALAEVAGTTARETQAAMARFTRDHLVAYGQQPGRVRIQSELVGAILRE